MQSDQLTPDPAPTEAAVAQARVLAHYLPQFHPVVENDDFWGPGFTEWTSVAGSRPRFKGHEQPELPGELGFYDLRLPETRQAQADLARNHGIEAFLYWHYWFEGKRILERPFNDVLKSGEPDFPFGLAWANHSWTQVWKGRPNEVIIEQTYPGPDDTRRHFASLEPAFHDKRYVRVNGKPLFFLFRPDEIPDLPETLDLWRTLAERSGLGGLHIAGRVEGFWARNSAVRVSAALDAVTDHSLGYAIGSRDTSGLAFRVRRKLLGERPARVQVFPYDQAVLTIPRLFPGAQISYPTVMPGWDSTPRHAERGLVLQGRTPEAFEQMMSHAIDLVRDRNTDDRIVFLKSWNEWAEGNFIEPDRKWGRDFLVACRRAVFADPNRAPHL